MTTTPHVDALLALGFTETEALVYCALVRDGSASGYKLAKATGKARANVYQALSTLAQKGAVLSEGADVQLFRATAPAELTDALQHGFEARTRAARDALERLATPEADDRIYHLKTVDQALERAGAMIDGATGIVLVDGFLAPLAVVTPHLERAAARGVVVAGMTYGARPPSSFPLVESPASRFVLARWPGLQLTVVADGREHLVALFSAGMERVEHGIWSDSRYLSCLHHSGLSAEIRLASLQSGGDPLEEIGLLRAYPAGLAGLVGPADSGLSNADKDVA